MRLLLGPGPSPVAPRVYEAMSKPIVGHLDPFFFQVNQEIHALLNYVWGTENTFTMAISGTGSAGMETALSNFVEPGSKFLVFANGFFSDRIAEMGKRQGATVVRVEGNWGETFSSDLAREVILRERPTVVGYVTAETSTGAWNDGKAICEAAHEVGAIVIADCVTSLGTMPINLGATGIDVAFSCSQKGLSCPPGLSPITVSPRGVEYLRNKTTVNRSWYFDLKLLLDYYEGSHRYHHTAPISMFYALREGLALIHEEGLENRFARHKQNHETFAAGAEALGMPMLVAAGHRLWPLQTPVIPAGISDVAVRKHMIEAAGIEIMGGFGPLAGKIFRVGLMGEGSKRENVLLVLKAMEAALRAEGYTPPASGVAAAEERYTEVDKAIW
jgi:alanine-glyoxylate transaminase/serine-glyoxylate transaminase/serine-pyruvate transaminase